MARIDPHLTYGCEIALDTNPALLHVLQMEQNTCLRRILGLGPKSMTAVLHTETGTLPIQYRRILLALNHLKYLIQLPPHQYAHAALRDSISLIWQGKPSWIGDVKYVLAALPVPVTMLTEHISSVEGVDALIQLVKLSCAQYLNSTIEDSSRVPLLHERVKASVEPSLSTAAKLRPYLVDINIGDHRLAVMRLLCVGHCLAIEQMRHKRRRREIIPRHERLCRFCRVEVEDEPHALFLCDKIPLNLKIRKELLFRTAREVDPEIDWNGAMKDEYDRIRNKDISRNTRYFLWMTLQDAYMIGRNWLRAGYNEELRSRSKCTKCDETEDMEHVLFKCEATGQREIWKLAKELWTKKTNEEEWPELSLGTVIASGMSSLEKRRENSGEKAKVRFRRILMTEALYLIWKMRCERVIQNEGEDHTLKEIRARFKDTMNKRLKQDMGMTHRRFQKKALNKKVVLETWRGVLQNEENLTIDWISARSGVLVVWYGMV